MAESVWRLVHLNPWNRLVHFQKARQMRAPNSSQKIFCIIVQNRRTAFLEALRLFGAIDDSGQDSTGQFVQNTGIPYKNKLPRINNKI